MEEEDKELEQMINDALAEKEESDKQIDEDEVVDENSDVVDESTTKDADKDATADEETDKKTESKFEPVEIDVNGVKIKIESLDEMLAFAKKGASTYNQKPETYVEEKAIIEQGKLTADDLKLLVDARNGSPEAIAKLAKMSGVDTFDIDETTADKYTQKFQPHIQSEVDKVASDILNDSELATSFRSTVSALPQEFVSLVTSDATMLKDFARHVKEGIAQEIIPLAVKAQMVNGGTFFDNYSKVGQELVKNKANAKESERVLSDKEKELRERADKANTKNVPPKQKPTDAEDIWNLSDEEFSKTFGV